MGEGTEVEAHLPFVRNEARFKLIKGEKRDPQAHRPSAERL